MPSAPTLRFTPPTLEDVETVQALSQTMLQDVLGSLEDLMPGLEQLRNMVKVLHDQLKQTRLKLEPTDVKNNNRFSMAEKSIENLDKITMRLSLIWREHYQAYDRLKDGVRRADVDAIHMQRDEFSSLSLRMLKAHKRLTDWQETEFSMTVGMFNMSTLYTYEYTYI